MELESIKNFLVSEIGSICDEMMDLEMEGRIDDMRKEMEYMKSVICVLERVNEYLEVDEILKRERI